MSDIGHVKDIKAKSFEHSDGKRCVETTTGAWVKEGEGLDEEAVCHRTHGAVPDPVNHPSHYRWLPGDIEVIDITENLNFCLGNAIKYILRADHKGKPVEDLEKAAWYIQREIERRNRSDA